MLEYYSLIMMSQIIRIGVFLFHSMTIFYSVPKMVTVFLRQPTVNSLARTITLVCPNVILVV